MTAAPKVHTLPYTVYGKSFELNLKAVSPTPRVCVAGLVAKLRPDTTGAQLLYCRGEF